MKRTPNVQNGSVPAPEKFRITIDPRGPYFVYGSPPLSQQFFVTNNAGEIWYYQDGDSYPTEGEPIALCRCGCSANPPYCDGSHIKADWDPKLTASEKPLLSNIEEFDGPALTLTDNENYCSFARFCDAKGRIWKLVDKSGNEHAREWVIREANRCPAGRLSAWDRTTDQPFEPVYDPSLKLVQDPDIDCSGPLWVRGGIAIERDSDGFVYEIRNRVTLCRCGQSSNKPYCDGTHASIKYRDNLNWEPRGDKY